MPTIRTAIDEDRVRLIAHSLWIEEGMPEGRAESHWFKALELIDSEAVEAARVKPKARNKAPAAAAKKSAPRKRG